MVQRKLSESVSTCKKSCCTVVVHGKCDVSDVSYILDNLIFMYEVWCFLLPILSLPFLFDMRIDQPAWWWIWKQQLCKSSMPPLYPISSVSSGRIMILTLFCHPSLDPFVGVSGRRAIFFFSERARHHLAPGSLKTIYEVFIGTAAKYTSILSSILQLYLCVCEVQSTPKRLFAALFWVVPRFFQMVVQEMKSSYIGRVKIDKRREKNNRARRDTRTPYWWWIIPTCFISAAARTYREMATHAHEQYTRLQQDSKPPCIFVLLCCRWQRAHDELTACDFSTEISTRIL